MIEVVSAVIVRNGRLLLTQRRHDKDFPFTWESPGGKVEGNESHHDALRRELKEELGINNAVIGVGVRSLWMSEFNHPSVREDRRQILLIMYPVGLEANETPTPQEDQGIGWFTVEEMLALKLAPGNERAKRAIAEYVRWTEAK